jgi:hypothetical protein
LYGVWSRGADSWGFFTNQIDTQLSSLNHPSYQVPSACRKSNINSLVKCSRSCKRNRCLYGGRLRGADSWGVFTNQIDTRLSILNHPSNLVSSAPRKSNINSFVKCSRSCKRNRCMNGVWSRGADSWGFFTNQIDMQPSSLNHPSYQVPSACRKSNVNSLVKSSTSCKRNRCMYGVWSRGADSWGFFTNQIDTQPSSLNHPSYQVPSACRKFNINSLVKISKSCKRNLCMYGVWSRGADSWGFFTNQIDMQPSSLNHPSYQVPSACRKSNVNSLVKCSRSYKRNRCMYGVSSMGAGV